MSSADAITGRPTERLRVIAASAAGTAFEWYDFFIYGSLASIIAKKFFSGVGESTGYIFALLIFGVGFGVRPLGAIVFGRIGDMVGRKWAFLATITLMGVGTVAIGLLPTHAEVGIWAPVLLIGCRVLQGFALGGEYGGAAIYVAEHAPADKRGWHTSFIQTSAGVGLLAALGVVLTTRQVMGEDAFAAWGWRVPFLLSLILVVISIYVRSSIEESPVFSQMRKEGRLCKAPYRETFLVWKNFRIVLLVLLGIMMAQGVIWYTAYFQAQFFMERVLKMDGLTVNMLLMAVTACSTLLYCFFGWLSDRVGRKPVLLFGMLGAICILRPAFEFLTEAGNPALAHAMATAPVTVIADRENCSLQFDPVGKNRYSTSCDIAKSALTNAGVSYQNLAAPHGAVARVMVGEIRVEGVEGGGLDAPALKATQAQFQARLTEALAQAGYPPNADPARVDRLKVFTILLLLMVFATALYGPQAAALVELFPPHIRYTALSVPYHIGTGWFGGFLPSIAFALMAETGSIYAWLWYPIVVGGISAVICLFFIPETRGRPIHI